MANLTNENIRNFNTKYKSFKSSDLNFYDFFFYSRIVEKENYF